MSPLHSNSYGERRHGAAFGGDHVLDLSVLEALSELGGDEGGSFLLEVMELYVDDASQRIYAIEASMRKHDNVSVAKEAHALKSASANVGALQFSELCREIEACARVEESDELVELVRRMGPMYMEVAELLSEIKDDLSA